MKFIEKFDSKVRQEQIRILYQQSPIIYLGIIFVMVIVVSFFWGRVPNFMVISWVSSIVILTVARIAMVLWFNVSQPQGEALSKWGLAFAFSSLLSGLLWGSISIIFIETTQFETVLMVAIVLTGMCAGSLVPLSAFIPAYFGFCIPAMTPLAITLFEQADSSLDFIGFLVLAYTTTLLAYSFVVNRNLADSIKLRFENLDLLENLRYQKDIAEKANSEKSRFLAATSHDLRQPLHAMDLYLGALDKLLQDEAQKQLLQKSRTSSAALRELLEALMDISRLDAGNINVQLEPVNVNSLLNSLYEEYQAQAIQQKIEMHVHSRSAIINTDKLLLERMIRNLLSNAISHSNASKILVSARQIEGKMQIEIRDNGCGIPETEQEQIFSEFYQLENPERDRNKGLGLGLAIVKRLSTLLNHDLQLFSKAGRGSCFRIKVPVTESFVAINTETSVYDHEDISGLFIMFIEDEDAVRDAMCTLLKQWGCELLSGNSLSAITEDLDALDYSVPDVIISDYRLRNDQSGLDVIITLRKRFSKNIPAIIITGDTGKAIMRKAKKQHCSIMIKPVSPQNLLKAIARSQLLGTGSTDT